TGTFIAKWRYKNAIAPFVRNFFPDIGVGLQWQGSKEKWQLTDQANFLLDNSLCADTGFQTYNELHAFVKDVRLWMEKNLVHTYERQRAQAQAQAEQKQGKQEKEEQD